MSALSEFYEPIRFLIGDDDPDIHLRENAQLDAAMKTVLNLGRVTGTLTSGNYAVVNGAISPNMNPADDPKAFAQLLFNTAKFFVTDLAPTAWRTRAFSETVGEHREKVFTILEELYRNDHGGMGDSSVYE